MLLLTLLITQILREDFFPVLRSVIGNIAVREEGFFIGGEEVDLFELFTFVFEDYQGYEEVSP